MATNHIYPYEIAQIEVSNSFKINKFLNSDNSINKNSLNSLKKHDLINYKLTKNSLLNISNKDWGQTQKKSAITRSLVHGMTINISTELQSIDNGVYFKWLKSRSKCKRKEHATHYNKVFSLKTGYKGDLPGKKYGCKCGMAILPTNQTKGFSVPSATLLTSFLLNKVNPQEKTKEIVSKRKLRKLEGRLIDKKTIESTVVFLNNYKVKSKRLRFTLNIGDYIYTNSTIYIRNQAIPKLEKQAEEELLINYINFDILSIGNIPI